MGSEFSWGSVSITPFRLDSCTCGTHLLQLLCSIPVCRGGEGRSASMSHICWCFSLIHLHLQAAACDVHPGIIGNVCLTFGRRAGIKTWWLLSGITPKSRRDDFHCRLRSVSAELLHKPPFFSPLKKWTFCIWKLASSKTKSKSFVHHEVANRKLF